MMKKYLMTAIAAVAMGAAFTSCSHNDDLYNGEENNKQNEQHQADLINAEYEAAFEAVFGTPDPNHDWGFGRMNAANTRSVVKKDQWENQGKFAPRDLPADITDYEREYVTGWFQDNPDLTPEGKDFKNFFIQWVSGDFYNKKGIWHRHDQNRPANEGKPADWDEEFTDNAVMDYLIVSNGNGYTEHVNDFNSNSGGPWSIVYMENSSALKFGYHSSWDNGDYQYFKMAEIDVPGVGKGWYVGLSVYGKKYDNGDKELGIQRLQYAEDWILKIVPADPSKIRVIAEDLSASDASDFDFNDVVFDVEWVNDNKAQITLQAAGGILPLYIEGNEVHKKFGLTADKDGYYEMVNTGAGPEIDPVTFTVEGTFNRDAKNIKITVDKLNTNPKVYGLELTAVRGKAAGKIGVSTRFQWCPERNAIDKVYPRFKDYVKDATKQWY